MDTVMYKEQIMAALQGKPIARGGPSRIYELPDDKVAKVMSINDISVPEMEYENLVKICEIDDPDLNVPFPYAYVELGEGRFISNELCDYAAVVMEHLYGPTLGSIPIEERAPYSSQILTMLNAMIRHNLCKGDLKPSEIFLIDDKAYFCDAHWISWRKHDLSTYDYRLSGIIFPSSRSTWY